MVRRELGRRLRALREEAGKTITDVAEAKLFSPSKMFRLESGRGAVKVGDVWALCRFYDAPADHIHALTAISEGTHQDAWWEDHHRVSPPWFHLYRGLEATCATLSTYHPELVHGLLQTDEYARAVAGVDGERDEEVLRRRVDLRLERQLAAFDRPGKRITAVVGAGAFAPRLPASVLQHQLAHLCELSDGDSIDIRVLPWRMGTHGAFRGPFTLMEFDDPADPDVIYIETLVGAHYVEREVVVSEYRTTLQLILDQSIPVKEFQL